MRFVPQHILCGLPTGFMKVRYYGFLSPTAKMPLEEVQARIELAYGFAVTVPEHPPAQPETFLCTGCGGALRFHRSLRPGWRNSVREDIVANPSADAVNSTG
jgi:hypothetical protein